MTNRIIFLQSVLNNKHWEISAGKGLLFTFQCFKVGNICWIDNTICAEGDFFTNTHSTISGIVAKFTTTSRAFIFIIIKVLANIIIAIDLFTYFMMNLRFAALFTNG